MEDLEGFWGLPTASINWCEPNYTVSYYVAEFWNTISNFALIVLGFFGAYINWKLGFERRWILLNFTVFCVGLGSMAFHGTLLYSSQLGDELPMIWAMLVWTFICIDMNNQKGKTNKGAIFKLSVIAFFWTINSFWIHRHYNIVFEMFFIGLVVFCIFYLFKTFLACEDPIAKRMFKFYLWTWFIAIAFWISDFKFCKEYNSIWEGDWKLTGSMIGSLHGYWHIVIGLNSYVGPLFGSMVRVDILGEVPELCWFASIIPYVKVKKLAQAKAS